MFLTSEERSQAESLLKDTQTAIANATNIELRSYYQAKERGLKASLEENPHVRWTEVLDNNIFAYFDSSNSRKRIDAIGYNDGFMFNEPGMIIGPEHLEFKYLVEPATSAQDDLGHIWMERTPGWRRQCVYIDYPQPPNSPLVGMRPGHFRFRQVSGDPMRSTTGHIFGPFPFEGNGLGEIHVKAANVKEACESLFVRFQVPSSRYTFMH